MFNKEFDESQNFFYFSKKSVSFPFYKPQRKGKKEICERVKKKTQPHRFQWDLRVFAKFANAYII